MLDLARILPTAAPDSLIWHHTDVKKNPDNTSAKRWMLIVYGWGYAHELMAKFGLVWSDVGLKIFSFLKWGFIVFTESLQ